MNINNKYRSGREYTSANTNIISMDWPDSHAHRPEPPNSTKGFIQNIAIGTSIVGGATATTVGVIAAGASTTGALSAAVGGTVGAVVGSSVGLATGGIGMAATVPFAVGGAAIGGWAGPALALFGIGTAPAWAMPLAIGGGVVAIGGTITAFYKYRNAKSQAQKHNA